MGIHARIVRKCNLWGVDLLIFVTVGTQDVPFDRLIKAVEKEIEKGTIKEEVIVQCGCTKIVSDKMKIVKYLSIDEFTEYIKKANLVIAHGGVGTIMDILKYNKVGIVCPRLSKYKEHGNDHQIEIVKKFSDLGYIIPLNNPESLESALKKAKNFKPQKYKSNTKNMVNLIENFIDTH